MTNPPDRVRTAAGYEVSKPSHFRLALLVLEGYAYLGAVIGVFVAFNASAVQVSRAGIFWPRNTLLLGYPLLAMLSPKQTRAVIAHELGHMTHAHGRISSWVHRTRLSWVRLMKNLDERGATPAHAHLLFRWYVPRLHAMSAAVSRQQELVADHLAASVTSPETTAQALVATEVGGDTLDRTFWPDIFDRVRHDPATSCPFGLIGPEIWTRVGHSERATLLENLLGYETDLADPHPSLRDRLARLGQPARLPGIVSVTAADQFLGQQKQQVVDEFDRQGAAGARRNPQQHGGHGTPAGNRGRPIRAMCRRRARCLICGESTRNRTPGAE